MREWLPIGIANTRRARYFTHVRILRRIATVIGVGVAASAFTYGALVLLTPTFGRIVGYANSQAPLRIVQNVPHPSPTSAIIEIRDIAEWHFQSRPQLVKLYWPNPSLIEERTDCWLVVFDQKIPVYEFLGFRQTLAPTDTAMYMSIAKSDLSMRWGAWCQ